MMKKLKKNLKFWSIRYKEAVMNTLVILFFSQNILKIILFSKSASLVILWKAEKIKKGILHLNMPTLD